MVLLTYFLVSLFYSGTADKKQREATATIGRIADVISNLTSTGGSVETLQPQRWFVFSFLNEEKKPNYCFGKNCVCICMKGIPDIFDRQI